MKTAGASSADSQCQCRCRWGGRAGLHCGRRELTSMRRLDRLPQVVGALLSDIIVSASSSVLWRHSHRHCRVRGSLRTWSGALGRCGPAPRTVRSAAPLCLLHLGRAAEEKGSCGPSIRRRTQRRCVIVCVWVWVCVRYALCRCKVTRDWGTRAKRVEGSPSSRLGNEQVATTAS